MADILLSRRCMLSLLAGSAALSGCTGLALAHRLARPGQSSTFATDPAAAVARYQSATGVRSLSVRIFSGSRVRFSADAGNYRPDTQICIASASKWLVGATLMIQVEKGLIGLDDPIGRYIDGLPKPYAATSIGQLASFTAGLPSLQAFTEFRQPEDISLANSAWLAAQHPLASQPGTQFDYGGANLQFVGAAIEAVTGMSWHAVFANDLAAPIGLTNTLWGRMSARPDRARPVNNPVLQAGAWTSADDYCTFLSMIAGGGEVGGRRILSSRALSDLARLHTVGLATGFAPPGAPSRHVEYAIAHWCEEPVGQGCHMESSPGFYGTYPWINHRTGVFGIIFQEDRLRRVSAEVEKLRAELETFANGG